MNRPYHIECEVVCVGQSPKTEYVWYDQHAFDDTDVHVATLRMQSRAMKASSPLYADHWDEIKHRVQNRRQATLRLKENDDPASRSPNLIVNTKL